MHPPSYDRGQGPESGLLIEYCRLLFRRRGTLILASFLGALAGFFVSLPQTPVYQAHGSVEIQDLNEDFLNIKRVSPVSEPDPSRALSDIETQIRILQSDSLLERVLARLDIRKPEDLRAESDRTSAWRRILSLPFPSVESKDAIETARRNLGVRQARDTRIVEILYDSADPALATRFVNALVAEYIDQSIEARWKMSQHTGDWLTRQLEEIRFRLQRSEDALQGYARKSGLIFTSERNNISEDKLRQLQEALSKAQADRIAKQSRYEMANSSAPETLPDVLNDSSLRDYQQKLAELRRQRAELSTTYAPEYNKVKRVEAQIASLESDLQKERAAIIKRIRNEYDEALQREKLLMADYAEQTQRVTQEAEKSIQYNILKREVDTNRQLYDAMLQRVKEANIASALRATNVRIVDPARAPKRPYKPRTPLNTGLGLLTGAFLGVALVLARERADRSIQQPGELSVYLNVPELGVIPSLKPEVHGLWRLIRQKGSSELPDAQKMPGGEASSPDGLPRPEERLELVALGLQKSLAAESFRAVLTSILFASRNSAGSRAFVVTSASPSEGKSTVACNLAIALAGIHERVLLVDGDLHRARLHEIFGIPNNAGLADLLNNGAVVQQSLDELTLRTPVPGLFLLPGGHRTAATPSDLLHRGRMPEVLDCARSLYDRVVIDSPPMLELPDARVLGRLADGVILVARAGKTTRDAILAAKNRLAADGTVVLGTVLNDWNPESSPGGYYGSYAAGYKAYTKYYSGEDIPAKGRGREFARALSHHVPRLLAQRPACSRGAKTTGTPDCTTRTTADEIRKIVENLDQVSAGIEDTLRQLGKLKQEDDLLKPPQRAHPKRGS